MIISLYVYLSLSLYIYIHIYIHMCVSIYIYICICTSISLRLSLSPSLRLSIIISLSLNRSLSVSLSISLSISISTNSSISITITITITISINISITITISIISFVTETRPACVNLKPIILNISSHPIIASSSCLLPIGIIFTILVNLQITATPYIIFVIHTLKAESGFPQRTTLPTWLHRLAPELRSLDRSARTDGHRMLRAFHEPGF